MTDISPKQADLSVAQNLSDRDKGSAFSCKALFFGFLGVFLLNAFAAFNDDHIKSTLFIGNHLPIGTYCLILFVVVGWNPLAGLVSWILNVSQRWLVLGTRELAVMMGVMLVGSWTPTSGLYRYFQRQLILPWFKVLSHSTWQKYGILEYLPKKLFPLPGAEEANPDLFATVYTGFVTGLGSGKDVIWPWSEALTKVVAGTESSVWGAWLAPLTYWGPLLMCFSVATIALSLLVHRQWAHHEQLSYPLASISTSLIRRDKGRILPDIFYSKLFLWGVGFVVLLHGISLMHAWFPDYIPRVRLNWWLQLERIFPTIDHCGVPSWGFKDFRVYFTVIGVAYFLSSQIGFTMGAANIILLVFASQYYLTTGVPVSSENMDVQRGGAYIGYALILLYTGRTYYWAVVTKALGFGRAKEHEVDAVLAARVLSVAFFGFVWVLTWMGLSWIVALLFSGLLMLMFLVFTRIVCESGIPFLQTGWLPGVLLAKVVGLAAVGPGALTFVYWMGTILAQDPRECMMPYVATSLKIADDTKVKLRWFAHVAVCATLLALIIGFVARCTECYNFGAMEDGWASGASGPAVSPFDQAARDVAFMQETGQFEASAAAENADGWMASLRQKTALIRLDGTVMGYLTLGIMGVVVFSVLRFRFSWWPIHPIMLLVWGTYPSNCMAASFVLGWIIKELVVRFAGGKVYQDLKPLFIGLIVGEMLAAILGVLVGASYYFCYLMLPEPFGILPG